MPITSRWLAGYSITLLQGANTVVDKLELRDDIQADVGEIVFEHRKEHGEEMLDGPGCSKLERSKSSSQSERLLVFAQNRGQPTDLHAERGPHVLRRICDELFYAVHNVM